MSDIELTADKKKFIDDNYQRMPDILELTRAAFMNDALDGRTKEGRAVRKYMAEKDYAYNTTKPARAKGVRFTDAHKEFILANVDGMKAYEIAQILFPERGTLGPLSKESRQVAEFIQKHRPQAIHPSDSGLNKKYQPAPDLRSVVERVNEFGGQKLDAEKMGVTARKGLEALILFLQAPRFNQVIGNYTNMEDRHLFEAEFIRATWDKPDLTSDEVNLYINVCIDYINLQNIQKAIEKLNRMFEDCDEQRDMTVRLAELLKTKSEEYNQCEKRMESLISKLNGDRAKRVQNQHQANASILNLVQLFQEEEERKVMIKIAQMQNKLVKEEADHLESMPDWKARVLGMRKEDVI